MAMSSDQDSFRGFCESLINNTSRVGEIHYHHHLTAPWSVDRHAHDDILQLDCTQDVVGEVLHEDSRVSLSGTMLLAFHPGVVHGFKLPPQTPHARIFSVKLLVNPSLPFIKEHRLSAFRKNPTGCASLPMVMKRLYHLKGLTGAESGILVVAAAMEMLAMWPRGGSKTGSPVVPASMSSAFEDDASLNLALSMIESRMTNPPKLAELSRRVGLSRRQLTRRFHDTLGVSPMRYFQRLRLDLAKTVLATSGHSVTEAASSLGFPDVHHFSRWFSRMTGMPPSEFQKHPGLL